MHDRAVELNRHLTGMGLEGWERQVYSEEAFDYLLAVERRRTARSRRSFLLLLVDLLEEEQPGGQQMGSLLARDLFANLLLCVRDTDFVGWYRDRCIAGAVMTQVEEGDTKKVASLIGRRVTASLRAVAAPKVFHHLRVRIYEPSELESENWGERFHSISVPSVFRRSFLRKCIVALRRAAVLTIVAANTLFSALLGS